MEDHLRLPTCNPQIHHQQNPIQSFQPDHDDEFLQQMLSTLPNPNPFLHSIKPLQTSPFPSINHDHSLSSKLRSSSPMADAAAKSYLLHQQQLLISRDRNPGAGTDVELTPFPSSLADADVPTFLSTPQGAADSSVQALFSGFPAQQPFQAGEISAMNQPPASGQAPQRQRVRARRGQATDPHSIAERLRRERIAERMKALQELVPNANKTDKASMLDEIIDYVKFMQLQVKVLSMSRLGGAASHPTRGGEQSLNNGNPAAGSSQEGMSVTEQQVLKLMEEDMGSAMQYLQGKGLCLMPISLATAISTATSIVNRQPPPPPRPHNPVFPLTANGNGHGVQAQPSSPNLSGLTVQSTRLANGDGFVNKTNPRPQA